MKFLSVATCYIVVEFVALGDGLRLIVHSAMAFLPMLAAVIAALLTAVVFGVVAFTVYLVIVHRRYAHIPQPKGAS